MFIENAGDLAVLKFSELHNICKVEINGEQAGIVLWKPYEIETDLIKNGKNHIKITVYTTAAATLNEKALPYGIEGPVVLDIMECTEEKK